MNKFLTLTVLKRVALAMGCIAVICLLWGKIGKVLDSLTVSSERVYQLPESTDAEPVTIDPEVLAAQQKKLERMRSIEMELMQPVSTNDPDKMLAHLELQEEMLTLHQAEGTLVTDETNPFLMFKLAKLVLSNLTPDKKLPVDVGVEIVDLLIENGEFDGAASFLIATQRAVENGDTVFEAVHWGEVQTVGQSSPATAKASDPCCPDDETEAVLPPSPSVSKTPALVNTDSVVEVQPQKPLSLEQFNRARALIDEYGTEEGLERLRAVDPEAVDRFESVPRAEGVHLIEPPAPAVDDQ